MRRTLLYLSLASFLSVGCEPSNPMAPGDAEVLASPPPFLLASPESGSFVVDNGDGTATLTFQPGPGLNDGTDQGTEDAGKDAFVFSGGSGDYSGSEWAHHWRSTCNNFTAHSLYRFEVADLPGEVLDVKLVLRQKIIRAYNWAYQSPTTHMTLFPLVEDWQENTVSWGNQPALGPPYLTVALNTTVGVPLNDGYGHRTYYDDFVEMDITSLYTSWKENPGGNHGVAYQRVERWCENANSNYTAMSDMVDAFDPVWPRRAAWRPKLVITYASEPPNAAPEVTITGASVIDEGGEITLFAEATDADGDPVSLSWSFEDGFTAQGSQVSRAFADDESHSATVVADDGRGGIAQATFPFQVLNVAPTVSALPGAELLVGESYSASGTFSDPGADLWNGQVDWGQEAEALVLEGMAFSLSHTFTSPGSFTVTVAVSDDEGGTGMSTASVLVLTPMDFIDILIKKVEAFPLKEGPINSFVSKLENAKKSLAKGNTSAAANQVRAFSNELAAALQTGKVPQDQGLECMLLVDRILRALEG